MIYLKRALILLFAVVILFAAYTLVTTGFFRTIENTFDGELVKRIPLKGAEDITISYEGSFAIVSATDRQIFPANAQEKGGLYFIDLKSDEYEPILLSGNFNHPFAPHGISLYKKDSSYLLLVVNHTTQGERIELFELNGKQLTHKKTFADPSMIRPNDVVMIDENRFYFTNDHGYTEGLGKLLEEYLGLKLSNVVYYDGEQYREVADNIAYANGINYDRVQNILYVASPRDFLVKVYTPQDDGSLRFRKDIHCQTGVDNIEFDQRGNLWIGAHPDLLHFSAYAKGKKDKSPSEIIKITYQGSDAYVVDKVFVDDGTMMSGASVAAPFDDLILTGNVMDDDFLILKSNNFNDGDGETALTVMYQVLADSINAKLGAYVYHVESRQFAQVNGEGHYPMQSVYKFPIALLMLRQIDAGKFNLDDTVWISPSKYIPKTGHSPMRENYPEGVTLTIQELIKYNVAQSDGTACDILLELMGGTEQVQQDLEALGINNMNIATTEMVQVANDTIQYQNWSTPKAMAELFLAYHNGEFLSNESKTILDEYLSVSTKWGDNRIKGLLPPQTPVAHKTGTSWTYNGLTRATNDAGIVTLPNGEHLILSVFLTDAYHSKEERNRFIASVAKSAYDYWTR